MSPLENKLIQEMHVVLASSYALLLKTQNFHWNVSEKKIFYALHQLFDDQYNELNSSIDEIAEQIRQLGSKVRASFKDFQELSIIASGNSQASSDEMLKTLQADHKKMMIFLGQAIQTAQSLEGNLGEGVADLLVGRMRAHSKQHWMLKSSC